MGQKLKMNEQAHEVSVLIASTREGSDKSEHPHNPARSQSGKLGTVRESNQASGVREAHYT